MRSSNDYLVGVCAHVNTDEKFKQLVEQLESLREEGLDVCLCINSNKYLSELSGYVKYLVFDSNNEFLDQPFYIENAEICHNNYGYVKFGFYSSGFSAQYLVPFHGHPKPAFKLWMNSFYAGWQNGYKWICHTEYDVKKPLTGWKPYFDGIIKDLNQKNKKAFYYLENGTMWGNCFVVSSEICENQILNQSRHIETNRDWVKYWGTAVAETCLSSIMYDHFKDSVIVENARESVNNVWGISDPGEIHQSSKSDFDDGINHFLVNKNDPEVVHIYPLKTDQGYELHLFENCTGRCNTQVEILNVEIFYDDLLVYSNGSKILYSSHWSINKLPSYEGVERISLSYEKKVGEIKLSYKESFLTDKIDYIWKYIMRLSNNS